MRILYLDCGMGAAGDMLMAALYELLGEEDRKHFLETMNRILPDVTVQPRRVTTCGIAATHMDVKVGGREETPDAAEHAGSRDGKNDNSAEHAESRNDEDAAGGHAGGHGHHPVHRKPSEIDALIGAMNVPQPVREHARAVYRRIADAESAVHGVPVTEIHFHEVGALDAIADITGVCLAMHILHPDRTIVSPVRVGSGQVRCAHGILPVPAPATAKLLTGIPCFGGDIPGELCTPTGAALIGFFAQEFGPMPEMMPENTGYGAGTKQLPSAANCVRAVLGSAREMQGDEVTELCCHIDDMTAEALAFAGERLMEMGALDISVAPLVMKKGRSGFSFTVICHPEDEERLAAAALRETTSNGVRVRRCRRYILTPSVRTAETSFGEIRVKCASGEGIYREKPEYEDVAAAARKTGRPFREVWEQIFREACRGDSGE